MDKSKELMVACAQLKLQIEKISDNSDDIKKKWQKMALTSSNKNKSLYYSKR